MKIKRGTSNLLIAFGRDEAIVGKNIVFQVVNPDTLKIVEEVMAPEEDFKEAFARKINEIKKLNLDYRKMSQGYFIEEENTLKPTSSPLTISRWVEDQLDFPRSI